MLTRLIDHNRNALNQIMGITAWGFTIVIASFVFFYAGCWIDGLLGTTPTFMIGLLILAVMLGVGRFYWDAWMKMKQQK